MLMYFFIIVTLEVLAMIVCMFLVRFIRDVLKDNSYTITRSNICAKRVFILKFNHL